MATGIEIGGVRMTKAAADFALETGSEPGKDVRAVRAGGLSEQALRDYCLDGADEDRVDGANEYVDAILEAATVEVQATSEIKVGSKVSVDDKFFARVLWVRGGEAGVREYGTRREDVYQVSCLRAR